MIDHLRLWTIRVDFVADLYWSLDPGWIFQPFQRGDRDMAFLNINYI